MRHEHLPIFVYGTLKSRLRELAFLNSSLSIGLHDERSGLSEEFCYENGITAFVRHLSQSTETAHPVIHSKGKSEHPRSLAQENGTPL